MLRYAQYARDTFRKDKRVNIRITSKNLEALQQHRDRAFARAKMQTRQDRRVSY
jgi:predicted DNA binding CopG/RHH family protein